MPPEMHYNQQSQPEVDLRNRLLAQFRLFEILGINETDEKKLELNAGLFAQLEKEDPEIAGKILLGQLSENEISDIRNRIIETDTGAELHGDEDEEARLRAS